MPIEFIVPLLGEKKTVRDQIISILSNEWPLSQRKIYNILVERHHLPISYQAVHKALKQLERNKVVEVKQRKYSLNLNWVKKMEDFSKQIRNNYSKGVKNISTGEIANFTFSTIHETERFLVDYGEKLLAEHNSDKKPILCTHWCHFWVPLFLDKETYTKMKNISYVTKVFFVTSSKTPIDRWCYEFWKKTHINTVIEVGSSLNDLVVFKDYVIEVFYPDELKKEIDKIFSSTESIADINPDELFKCIFERKTSIPVVININPLLAEQLRQKIIGYFKDKN